MAHPNLLINTIQYNNVPQIQVPIVGGGTANYYDASEANITGADIRNGKKAIGASGEVTGSMTEKAAASYQPSTSDQTINANQFLAGAQTIKKVVVTGLSAAVIAYGVTVKVGSADDDDCIVSYTGTLQSPVIAQDSITKILSIS